MLHENPKTGFTKVPNSTFLNVLVSHGWIPADGVAIATKEYQSAVGPKVAFAYLRTGHDFYLLSGDYQSKGNNILSNRSLLIEKPLTETEIELLVHEFAKEVDTVVADSYAVRLLRFSDDSKKPNNDFPTKEKVEQLKAMYLPGTRIKLLNRMKDDPYPVEAGAYGSVTSVDDAGNIHMKWDDNQGTLSLIADVDNFVIVKLTLEQFVATRKESACIERELHNSNDDEAKPGFIYLEGFYIEKSKDGGFYLPLGNNVYESKDLSELEKILYDEHFYY